MERLNNYLLEFGSFNPQQLELIAQSLSIRQLERGAYFSEAGKIPGEIAFVLEGILSVCYFNREGDKVIKYFVEENHFAVDLNSFQQQIPSSEYLQALTPMKLLVFKRADLDNLSATILSWDAVMAKVTNKALLEKVSRISPMLAEDARERYLKFHERFPQLVNRIPLQDLASYIGITKHSLSRIRKEISGAKG